MCSYGHSSFKKSNHSELKRKRECKNDNIYMYEYVYISKKRVQKNSHCHNI